MEFFLEIYNSGVGYTSVFVGRTTLNTVMILLRFTDTSGHPLIKRLSSTQNHQNQCTSILGISTKYFHA